ncbi:MAG TPA: glycosyltransferase family 39 protein [Flavobacteriales bacterium]
MRMAALLLLALVVRCIGIGDEELGHDEPFTVYWSLRPLGELFAQLRNENNPPLYFLLMHVWERCVPLEEVWLRIPSAIAGACTVIPLYQLGRRLAGPVTGITAALLFLFTAAHQGYAHEVRAYSLLTLLSATAAWQLQRSADMPRRWITLALVNIALVYTHFMGWCMVGVEVLAVLLLPALRPARRSLVRALCATVLAFLPYAWIFVERVGSSVAQGTWLTAPAWDEPYNMLWRWSNVPVLTVLFLSIIVVQVLRNQARPGAMGLPLLWSGVPLIGLFVFSFAVPVYLDRYLIFAAPGYALLVAIAFHGIEHSGLRAGLSAGAVLAMAFTLPGALPERPHPSRVVAQLRAWSGRPHTTIVVSPYWYRAALLWQWDRGRFLDPGPDGATTDLLLNGTEPVHDLIVVEADLPLGPAAIAERFGEGWTLVQSVQADRKVMVHRFQR